MINSLSWWEYEHFFNDLDYLIIGSGIVGLSTAIELKTANPSCKVLVIDKKLSPIGASTKNAGFACFGSISEILDDFDTYGKETCQKLISMRWLGLSMLKARIPAGNMMYESKPGAEIFKDESERSFYENKLSWVNSLVAPIVGVDQCFFLSEGKFGFQIINRLEGSLNPQMMMSELEFIARNNGVLFMNGVEVEEVRFEEKGLITNLGMMSYNNLVICTNGFSRKLLPLQDIRPARNQVLITNRIPGFTLDNCYHMNKGFVYFREYRNRLLIGGGRHLDEEKETTEELKNTELIISYLKDLIRKSILPGVSYKVDHMWSGILGVGRNKLPIVKKIDENVTVAIRMGGMGVAIGSFVGKVAAGLVLAINNSEQQLYAK